MRSIEEQMQIILRRKMYYTEKRRLQRMTALAAGLGLSLLATLVAVPGVAGSPVQAAGSVLGATILGPEAGGYVIVGLLAFALGVVTTLMIQRRKKAQGMKPPQDHGPAGNP